MPSSASSLVTSVAVKMGGRAAALVVSRNWRRRGVCLPSEKRFRRVRERDWVMMEVVSLASVKSGQSRTMCDGSHDCDPHGHRSVSGGSDGRNLAAYEPVNA